MLYRVRHDFRHWLKNDSAYQYASRYERTFGFGQVHHPLPLIREPFQAYLRVPGQTGHLFMYCLSDSVFACSSSFRQNYAFLIGMIVKSDRLNVLEVAMRKFTYWYWKGTCQ